MEEESKEDKYNYWNDPEYQPLPEMPQEPDPYKDLPIAERVLKYKEEGNALLNKNTEKAIMWYTRAIQTPHKVAADRAVFFSNRAAAHLLLENFRSALEDCEAALSMNPPAALKLKALYRGSKAAFGIGGAKLPLALKMCKEAHSIKATQDLKKLEEEIQREIKKNIQRQDDKEEKTVDKKEMAKLFADALKRRGWLYSNKMMYSTPYNDSKAIGMGYNDAEDIISMPVVIMYPQYRQSDLIQQCLDTQTLQEWLDKLFPPGGPPLPWDTEQMFRHEHLRDMELLVKTNDFPQNTRKQEWVRIDPRLPLRDILNCHPEFVIPKWPVIFMIHSSYANKFKALDIAKIQ